MKAIERNSARKLRKNGLSIGEIALQLKVSKGSVSLWVRDITLTSKQKAKLNKNGHSIDAIEKRRIARLARTKNEHEAVFKAALKEAEELSKNPLWCIGVSLYWGEGGKTQTTARIANSDPVVIQVMMRFFREVCKIPDDKIRAHIHTFDHCDHLKLEKYWSKITGLPLNQFYKTYKKQSTATKNKRDSIPFGTVQIYVHQKNFFFRIMGWIEYIKQNSVC